MIPAHPFLQERLSLLALAFGPPPLLLDESSNGLGMLLGTSSYN